MIIRLCHAVGDTKRAMHNGMTFMLYVSHLIEELRVLQGSSVDSYQKVDVVLALEIWINDHNDRALFDRWDLALGQPWTSNERVASVIRSLWRLASCCDASDYSNISWDSLAEEEVAWLGSNVRSRSTRHYVCLTYTP